MMIRVLIALVALISAPAWAQREAVHHNVGTETNEVVIADAFINDGFFEVQNVLTSPTTTSVFNGLRTPYDMSGTTNYVNNGILRALAIRFDTVDPLINPADPSQGRLTGYRTNANSFINTGEIQLADGFHFGSFPLFFLAIRGIYSAPFSYLHIDAKNIVNEGTMRIGAGGVMRIGHTNQVDGTLSAETVDLSTGTLVVDPVGYAYGNTLLGSTYAEGILLAPNPQTFLNDLGIYDVVWGIGTYTNQNQANFVIDAPNQTNYFVNVPLHDLVTPLGTILRTGFSLTNAAGWGFTFNKADGTNIIVQAVYVETGDTNVVADVRWYPSAYYWNRSEFDLNTFFTPIVKLSSITTNALNFQSETNAFYIADQFGSGTNFALLTNDRYRNYQRPANYFVTRSEPPEFLLGFTSNLVASSDIYFPGYSNVVVTNAYSGYVFNVENLVYQVPGLEGVSVKDLPGRVEIKGQSVNLTRTGIRAEGLVSVETDNLIGSAGAIIDAQNLAFNLSYTNAAAPATPLRFENLAKERVARLQGQVELWSGTFTNQFGDAASNVFNVLYHVLVVDARLVNAIQEVMVSDFQVKTADLNIRDSMIVSNRFDVTSTNLTIGGHVELRGTTWGSNLPNLQNLTVETNGALQLISIADFGTSARPLSNFVNQGAVTSYSLRIVADNVDVTGSLSSGQSSFLTLLTPNGALVFTNFFQVDSGPIFVTANQSARLNEARILTFGDVTLSGPVYKLDGSTISAGSAINLNVTGALLDSGPGAGNTFSSSNSFSLNTHVASGALLGTTINLDPPARGTYRFKWSAPTNSDPLLATIPIGSSSAWSAATNRAFNAYSTNMGVGRLTLHTGTNTVFEFTGTQTGRGLFVDLLEITGAGITNLQSLTNQLRLVANATSGIDIYYADVVAPNFTANVNLGFQTLAEFLNGKQLGGGRLIWVGTFNGPNTSDDVIISGTSVKMNRPLRRSQIIDLDQDGIANGNDDLPFQNGLSALRVNSIDLSQVNGKATVKFTAFQGNYKLQYTDSMDKPVWKEAGGWVNRGTKGQEATVTDPTSGTGTLRYYRVIHYPTGTSQ